MMCNNLKNQFVALLVLSMLCTSVSFGLLFLSSALTTIFNCLQVYIIAENQVLSINVRSHGTSHPIVVLFWGNASTQETSKEVLGLSTSMSTSSVYINIKNEGLFAYSNRGKLRWNALPVLNQFGYSQGCQKNVTNCYFTSSPIIDSCENSVYVCMYVHHILHLHIVQSLVVMPLHL